MAGPYPFYCPLDNGKQEIRVLEITSPHTTITSGNDDDAPITFAPIECRLHTVSLLEESGYTALSYVWGDRTIKEEIGVEGVRVPVTRNLAAALRRIQHHWLLGHPERQVADLRLWVDALCINQQDAGERAQQVQLMQTIYRDAREVFAWLGCDREEVGYVLEMLGSMGSELRYGSDFPNEGECRRLLRHLHRFVRRTTTSLNVTTDGSETVESALASFTSLDYWKRVWIFQEVAIPSNPLLLYGWRQAPLECALNVFYLFQKLPPMLFEDPDIRDGISRFTTMCAGSLPTMLELLPNARAFSGMLIGDSRIRTKALSSAELHKLVFLAGRRLDCAEPRDRIFGFLGLGEINVQPDYQKSLADVLSEFMQSFLASCSGRVDFLLHSGLGEGYPLDPACPTWMTCSTSTTPDYDPKSRADIDGFPPYQTSVISGQKLVVDAIIGPELREMYTVPDKTCNKNKLLAFVRAVFARAIRIDSEEASQYSCLAALWKVLSSSGWLPDNLHQSRHLAMLRVVGTDDISMLDEALSWMEELVRLFKAFADGTIESTSYDAEVYPLATDDPNERTWDDFDGRFASKHRDMFAIFPGPYFGVLCQSTLPGDRLCVINGLAMPAMIRPRRDQFEFIGPCAVIGLMDGEAPELVSKGLGEYGRIELI